MSRARKPPKPVGYKIVAISMYDEDLAELDKKINWLKALSVPKATRSAFIRAAIARLDVKDFAELQNGKEK